MANTVKNNLLGELQARLGHVQRLGGSQSLYVVGDDAARVYFRYSKVHPGSRTFFGLRSIDLQQLQGRNSFICFLTDADSKPLFVPFADFEDVFR